MFPSNYVTSPSFILLCGTLPWVCQFGNALIADADPRVDSTLDASIYFGHFPSGSSLKCLEHYAQLYHSKKFQMYDYGTVENFSRYNQTTPPEYKLDEISDIPIALFIGNTDRLGDLTDNVWLYKQIKDTLVFEQTYDYGHLTFFIGKDMVWLDDLKGQLDVYYPNNTESQLISQ